MARVDPAAIERFMRGQVTCWNAHDKPGFMAHYRSVASEALDIAYAGRDEQQDGWFVIEEMWDKHNERFELEVLNTIINGDDVAVHHRNCIRGTDLVIESIETYRFSPGRLSVCYFLQLPSSAEVDLAQFRGFA